jgi:hypothetical protein
MGISTGGSAPQGWLTEAGPQEELLRGFGLVECEQPGYDSRTRANVLGADGTVIFGSYATGGSALTARLVRNEGKPFFYVAFPEPRRKQAAEKVAEFREWLSENEIRTLNVAGNRESQNPGLQEFVREFLVEALG